MSKHLPSTSPRSAFGRRTNQKSPLLVLGLGRISHTVEREYTPAVRGMLNAVPFMVKVAATEMRLNTLSPPEASNQAGQRLGRGICRGLGTTVARAVYCN